MDRLRKIVAGGLALSFVVLLGSCAYTTKNALPAHVHSIAVPVFKNKTHVTDYNRKVEVDVTEAVRNTFLMNCEWSVVGKEQADLIVEGESTQVDRETLRSDRFGEAAEIRLTIKARISVYDVKEAKYLLQNHLVTNNDKKSESGVYNLRR